MGYLIYDGAILAILALFAWLGWRKGLLLSLCGLAAAIAAFLGAGFLADTLDGPAAKAILPLLEPVVEETVSQYGGEGVDAAADALREQDGLYRWIADAAQDADSPVSDVAQALEQATQSVTERVAHSVIFAVAFVLLYALLALLIRALNLVAKLPGLRFCNGLGGGVFGLVKGALVIFVLIGILMVSSFRPQEDTIARTFLFQHFVRYDPLVTLFVQK